MTTKFASLPWLRCRRLTTRASPSGSRWCRSPSRSSRSASRASARTAAAHRARTARTRTRTRRAARVFGHECASRARAAANSSPSPTPSRGCRRPQRLQRRRSPPPASRAASAVVRRRRIGRADGQRRASDAGGRSRRAAIARALAAAHWPDDEARLSAPRRRGLPAATSGRLAELGAQPADVGGRVRASRRRRRAC